MRLLVILTVILLAACETNPPLGNSVCSDNPGECTSSPPCLGNWVGSDCQIGSIRGTCTANGGKVLTPCCSCSNTAGNCAELARE